MNKKPITFVTFCVDIGRGDLPMTSQVRRDFYLYRQGFEENLRTQVPLVSYTSIEDLELPNHRNEQNIRYNIFKLENLINEFPNFDKYVDVYPHTHKDELAGEMFYYAPLVVLKMKKIMDVIKENPFQSDLFFWMDCYFSRGMFHPHFLQDYEEYIKMYHNISKKIGDKFLMFGFAGRPLGFIFGGTKKAFEKVYENYFTTFFDTLPNTVLMEETIFRILQEKNPELFHYVDATSSDFKNIVCDYLTK